MRFTKCRLSVELFDETGALAIGSDRLLELPLGRDTILAADRANLIRFLDEELASLNNRLEGTNHD